MAANQTREPVGTPKAQTAGSRFHPDTKALLVFMAAWLVLAAITGVAAAADALRGVDPTIYLTVTCMSWLLVTPWAMPSTRKRDRS